MKKGIAVAGNICLDIIKLIDKFPVRHGLVHVEETDYSIGGAVSNTGRDLAALDPEMPVRLVGLIGEDREGDEVLDRLKIYPNVDLSRIRREGKTSYTDVLTEKDTRARSFLFFGGANDVFDYTHVDVKNLNVDHFHVGYILLLASMDQKDDVYGTHLAHLLHDVQAQGIKTSVDVVSEVGNRYKTLVPPALKYADYFIVNELEAGRTVGIDLRDENDCLLTERIPEALKRLQEMGVREWVVIHAPEGGFGLDSQGNYVSMGSLELPKDFIVGTVGAGDAFCAGVIYAAYSGETMEQAIRDGIAAAAQSLNAAGASEAMRPMSEVRKLYERMPKRTV